MKKKNAAGASAFILIAVSGLLLCTLLNGCTGNNVIPSEKIELSIKNILEIPTCEQIYRDIVYIGEEQKILFFTTVDKQLLFSVDIRIQAGIKRADLIKVQQAGFSKEGRQQVVVSLPRAEILLADADEKTIEQYFLKEWGGEISRLEYYDEINRKKETLVANAVEAGLLDRAEKNAKTLLTDLLEASGIEIVEFRRSEGEI